MDNYIWNAGVMSFSELYLMGDLENIVFRMLEINKFY